LFRRKRSEIVDCLVDDGSEAGGSDVMPKNPAIHHLGKERRLRNKLPHQVGDVFLSLGRKRVLSSRPSAKRDDDNFSFLGGNPPESNRISQHGATQRHSRARTQEFASAPSQPLAQYVAGVRFSGFQARSAARTEPRVAPSVLRQTIRIHKKCSAAQGKYDAPEPKSSEARGVGTVLSRRARDRIPGRKSESPPTKMYRCQSCRTTLRRELW